MRIAPALKWSTALLTVLLIAVSALVFAQRRDRFLAPAPDRRPIVLIGARAYDPATDSTAESTTLVIRNREIAAISPDATVPEDARIFDLRGLTVLPGLIDSHVHVGLAATHSSEPTRFGWLGYMWRFLRKFPERRRAFIRAGITTVKSQGDPFPWIVDLADGIARHELAGPRIVFAGPMFSAPGGQPVVELRDAGQGDTSYIVQVIRQIQDTGSARRAVNRIADRVHFVATVLEAYGSPPPPRLTANVLRTIVATAHEHDLRAFAHVGIADDVDLALESGVDGIEHLPGDRALGARTLDLLVDRGIYVDPTLNAMLAMAPDDRGRGWARRVRLNLRNLQRRGVPLMAGSDAPRTADFGRGLHLELRALVNAGLSPREAIAAATSVAAEALGQAELRGTVRPGARADLIAVGGDPLSDIRVLADILLVIADGQILVNRLDTRRRTDGVLAELVRGKR